MKLTKENKEFFGNLLVESAKTGRSMQLKTPSGWNNIVSSNLSFDGPLADYRLEPEKELMKVEDLPAVCWVRCEGSMSDKEEKTPPYREPYLNQNTSLRDYFAGCVLTGVDHSEHGCLDAARWAYEAADAMMEERKLER